MLVVVMVALVAMTIRVRGNGGRLWQQRRSNRVGRRFIIGDRGCGPAQATIRQHEALRSSFQHANSILPTTVGESSSFNGSSRHRPTIFLHAIFLPVAAWWQVERVRARPLPRRSHATSFVVHRVLTTVLGDELDGSRAAHRWYPYIATGLRSVGEAESAVAQLRVAKILHLCTLRMSIVVQPLSRFCFFDFGFFFLVMRDSWVFVRRWLVGWLVRRCGIERGRREDARNDGGPRGWWSKVHTSTGYDRQTPKTRTHTWTSIKILVYLQGEFFFLLFFFCFSIGRRRMIFNCFFFLISMRDIFFLSKCC